MKRNLATWNPILAGAFGLVGAFAAASASCSGNSTTYLPGDGGLGSGGLGSGGLGSGGQGSGGKGGSVGKGGSSGAQTGGGSSGQAGDTSGTGGGGGGSGEAGSPGVIEPQPFVYEPFAYGAGLLDSNDGGFGWFGPWAGADAQVAAGGLTHASAMNSLVSSGGTALIPQSGSPYVFRSIDLAAVPASLRDQNDKIGAAGAELWLSFLAHVPAVPQPVGAVAGVQLYDGDAGKRFIGLQYYTDNPAQFPNWGLGHDLTHGTYTGISVTVEALLVVRFEFATEPGGNSATALWVNPDIDQRPTLGMPDTIMNAADFRFDRIAVGATSAETYFDEIRFGESYESVTPVR